MVHAAATEISSVGCGLSTCVEFPLGRNSEQYGVVILFFVISLVIIAANISMSLVMYMTLTKEYISQTLSLDEARYKRMVRIKTAIQTCGVLLLLC